MTSPTKPPHALSSIEPAGWARPRGYSNGILCPAGSRMLYVAGQIGWNAEQRFESDEFGDQFRVALANVLAVVRAAGGGPEHIARLTMYATSRDAYNAALPRVGAAYRELMGRAYPAMALVVVAALLEPRAQIEIEATAALPA